MPATQPNESISGIHGPENAFALNTGRLNPAKRQHTSNEPTSGIHDLENALAQNTGRSNPTKSHYSKPAEQTAPTPPIHRQKITENQQLVLQQAQMQAQLLKSLGITVTKTLGNKKPRML